MRGSARRSRRCRGFSSGVGQRVRMQERERQAVSEGGIGVAEGVSDRDDPRDQGVAGSVHVHEAAHRHDVSDRPRVVGGGHDVQRGDRRAGCPPRWLVAQHTQVVVGRRGEDDHGERSVVTPEGVEAHVPEVTARVQDRRVEMLATLGKLEVAAVVDGSRIGRFARRPRPAGWAAVATESVDHDVPASGIAEPRGRRGPRHWACAAPGASAPGPADLLQRP
jgi:hypothetical protein